MRVVVPALLIAALSGACASSPAAVSTPHRRTPQAPRHLTARPAPAVLQRPPATCGGSRACVDTRSHRAWLLSDGVVVAGPFVVSLGGAGHATPKGAFDVAWKDEVHTSSEYGTPMPYSVFFAPGGIAFHEGDVLHPSHGCVHLRHADAVRFFAALQRGDDVRVV